MNRESKYGFRVFVLYFLLMNILKYTRINMSPSSDMFRNIYYLYKFFQQTFRCTNYCYLPRQMSKKLFHRNVLVEDPVQYTVYLTQGFSFLEITGRIWGTAKVMPLSQTRGKLILLEMGPHWDLQNFPRAGTTRGSAESS